MTSRQRVMGALSYKGYDRIPAFYKATPEFNEKFMEYIRGMGRLDTDFRAVEPEYCGPELRLFDDGSREGLFGERYKKISNTYGAYDEAVFLPFCNISDVAELKGYRFPSPHWYDYSHIKQQCIEFGEYAIVFGGGGRMDFINGIARCRGVEQVLIDIAVEDPVYLKLIEKRHEFYYSVFENTLKAAEGMIDIIYIGEDFGGQTNLLISPEKFRKIFKPYLKKYIDLGHKYGAKVMMHSCGSVRKLIPEFIDMGLDILDAVQVDAADMDIKELHGEFHGKIVFHGSMSVQSLLLSGTLDDIKREVELRLDLFKDGGMILGPTHSIQPNTPVQNILEMYKCAGVFPCNW